MAKRVVMYARRLRFEWQARENRRITMAEASQRIGVSRNRLSQLELNQADEFTRDEIARFCDFYSEVLGRTVSPGELIGYETDSDAESATNKKPALTLA